MSTETVTPRTSRRWRWFCLVLALLMGIVALVTTRAYQLDIRRQALAEEIRFAGGYAEQPKSLVDTFQFVRSQGHFPTRQSYVMLRKAVFDNGWIRRHDYLRDFEIRILECNSITGDDLATLIDAHPLETLGSSEIELTPEVLRAIRDNTTLTQVFFGKSKCTDEQLAGLPLERLTTLSLVTEIGVTPNGALQVRRCRNLKSIALDGGLLTAELAATLQSLGTVTEVYLFGPEVNDERLQRLHGVSSLKRVHAFDTTTTPEGRTALAAALPNCQIQTGTAGH